METPLRIVLCLLSILTQFQDVSSHGRLMNPPARNTMWRVGYPCPANYNDNELFCGGYVAHQLTNDGKCGLCGDSYNETVPRPHETGGKFGVALPTRKYYSGQIINVVTELTSNHMGFFIFKICSIIYYKRECEDQSLLNRNVLPVVYPNGSMARRYFIETTEKKATFELKVLLPAGYNCTRCVLQWTYVTGNSWGTCEDGTEGLGCGKQETFINCADVTIIPMPYSYNHKSRAIYYLDPRLTSSSRFNQYRMYYRDLTRSGAPMTALSVPYQRCVALPKSADALKTPGQDEHCQSRCLKYPPDCPPELCRCIVDVKARKSFSQPMADQWCLDQCNVFPANNCNETRCEISYTKSHD